MNEMTIQALVRLLVTIVLFINALLTAKGINPLPFDENEVTEFLTMLFSGLMILWTWWKDAPMTKLAQKKYIEFEAERDFERRMKKDM